MKRILIPILLLTAASFAFAQTLPEIVEKGKAKYEDLIVDVGSFDVFYAVAKEIGNQVLTLSRDNKYEEIIEVFAKDANMQIAEYCAGKKSRAQVTDKEALTSTVYTRFVKIYKGDEEYLFPAPSDKEQRVELELIWLWWKKIGPGSQLQGTVKVDGLECYKILVNPVNEYYFYIDKGTFNIKKMERKDKALYLKSDKAAQETIIFGAFYPMRKQGDKGAVFRSRKEAEEAFKQKSCFPNTFRRKVFNDKTSAVQETPYMMFPAEIANVKHEALDETVFDKTRWESFKQGSFSKFIEDVNNEGKLPAPIEIDKAKELVQIYVNLTEFKKETQTFPERTINSGGRTITIKYANRDNYSCKTESEGITPTVKIGKDSLSMIFGQEVKVERIVLQGTGLYETNIYGAKMSDTNTFANFELAYVNIRNESKSFRKYENNSSRSMELKESFKATAISFNSLPAKSAFDKNYGLPMEFIVRIAIWGKAASR